MSYLSTAQTKLNGAWQKPLPLSRNPPTTPRYGPLTPSSRSGFDKAYLDFYVSHDAQRHRTPSPSIPPASSRFY